MAMKKVDDQSTAQALALANKGIACDARGETVQAVAHWQAASDYADQHLHGADIWYWIKSGLGAALLETGEFQKSIAVSQLALEWCAKIKQPLPSLTIAKCYFKLGDPAAAMPYAERAYHLKGDRISDWFEQAQWSQIQNYLRESRPS